jgi:hypothetical protein
MYELIILILLQELMNEQSMDQQPSPGETNIVVKPSQVNNVMYYAT